MRSQLLQQMLMDGEAMDSIKSDRTLSRSAWLKGTALVTVVFLYCGERLRRASPTRTERRLAIAIVRRYALPLARPHAHKPVHRLLQSSSSTPYRLRGTRRAPRG